MIHSTRGGVGAHTEQLADRSESDPPNLPVKTLERQYGQRLRGRFIKIRAAMRRGIVEFDVFGLDRDDSPPVGSRTEQLADEWDPRELTPAEYSPNDPARNHDRFMAWLRREQERGVVNLVSRNNNLYVRNAANRGVRYAEARLRALGRPVDSAELEEVFNAPTNANSLRLLFQRNYELLDGLTSDVSRQVSEVLSRGFAQGQGTAEIARGIADRIDSVGLNRAELISRHEIQYAANQAAQLRYRQHGVQTVRAIGTNPCSECAGHIASNPYPLNDLPGGGPPWHPRCRCTIVPVLS